MQEVDVAKIQKIMNNFTMKCSYYVFIGMDFKFDININQCHLAPLEKCVPGKGVAYVDWIIALIVTKQFKDNMQTIVVTSQGKRSAPIPDVQQKIK